MTKYQELPHDDTLEKGILSIILLNPELFIDVVDKLSTNDFYQPTHQQIWSAMTQLFQDSKEIDFPNIRIQLKNTDLDPRPALTTLAEAVEEEVGTHHLNRFIEEVKNKSMLRQIIRMSKSHAYTGTLDGAKAMEMLPLMEKEMLSLLDQTKDTQASDATGIIAEVESDLQKGIRDGWKGYSTGFAKLDNSTGGFIPSHTWIVGAYTGVGKTFLMLQFLLNVLRQGGRVALFSTEMDRKWNMLRLLGNIAQVGALQILQHKLLDEEIEKVQLAKKELASFGDRLMIFDNLNRPEQIRLKMKKLQLNGGLNMVAVDYIQKVKTEGNGIYERMANAATELDNIAKELNITTVIGSQVSQEAAGWQSKEAIEFKGAGEIAAVADVALWIKKTGDQGEREILMRKIRHGAPGKLGQAQLEFPSGRYIDLSEGGEGVYDNIKDQL